MQREHSKHDILLLNISEDYYLNNLSITDLCARYELSRYKILKYLVEAKEKGLVEIKVHSPVSRNKKLEAQFSSLTNIHFYIANDTEDLTHRDLNFWLFAANHLQKLINNETNIVALSWGDSIYKTIEQFTSQIREDLIFTQFIGDNNKYRSLAGSMRLVQKAATKYEANYFTLCAPLYLFNQTTQKLLAMEPIISQTLTTAKYADILITGISTPLALSSVPIWQENKNILFPNLDQAVGFLYGRPFDENGHFLVTPENDNTFGLTIEEILNIPKRVAICNSKFKADAVASAIKGNLLTHLIIDEKSALKCLALLT